MVEVVKYCATGRRKTSIARVVLTPGTGKILVNGKGFEAYFPRETDRILILIPFKLTNLFNKFDMEVNALGGGITGQAGAIKMAISRALTMFDATTRAVLKDNLCLRRDSRMKERKKPGQKGARRRFQWVKR
ncbi:MAG: 30S ribosomal protein S9 [Candidatus Omnitrophica bacterium]|nr:30S ribosomal protein S9 [Candidatus Omnitrophota bacterium]